MCTRLYWTLLIVPLAVLLTACEGPAGPAGPEGPQGTTGDSCSVTDNMDGTKTITCEDGTTATVSDGGPGTPGGSCSVVDNMDGTKTITCEGGGTVTLEDGTDYTPAGYVGATGCAGATCHQSQVDKFLKSGHGYKLRATGGVAPTALPNAAALPNGNYPASPPAGYTWADITYTIGGWGWKVRFLDAEGYIITCEKDDVDANNDGMCDTTDAATYSSQWNLATDGWARYHAGEFQKKYTCGPCHTTGYDPDTPTPGMPGIAGSWAEPGVTCEACHGPGGRHVINPRAEPMVVDRSAEACGSCHIRGAASSIPASGGFIRHHEQWNEMFVSKKHSMDCIDCHNPHQSARYADPTDNPNKGIQIDCASCHFEEAAVQNSPTMGILECIDCHMPNLTKSAVGNAAGYLGDVRTHLFGINTDVTAPQFNAGGTAAMPYLTLGWACRSCHPESEGLRQSNQQASVKLDAELEATAVGYHTR